MGQLSGSGAIFLSAGVPDPLAAHFVREGDTAAIAAAVSALLYVTLGRRVLVWGGHPAITPMIWSVAQAMDVDYGSWVKLYQSRFFEQDFPEENRRFRNVVFTEAVLDDRDASLSDMRRRMIEETDLEAAVFIGGMGGLFEELELVQSRPSRPKIIPIASTGGASVDLFDQLRGDISLRMELDYVALLHEQLDIGLNEGRYRRLVDQPRLKSDRTIVPYAPSRAD